MNYSETLTELRRNYPDLASEFAAFDSVMQAVDWMQGRDSHPEFDFVSHDEFSYDFLIRLDSIPGWLMFGVN